MIRFRFFCALLLTLVFVAACDQTEEQAPFQVETGTLTLYGFLDATRNVQRARIEPRRQDLDYPRTPAEAFLEDTEVLSYLLGETDDGRPPDTVRWVQRAERLPDGTYASVFSASFRPLPLERYRVVTRRAAGSAGPAAESFEDILIPAAGPAVAGDSYREGDRVMLPVTWPDSLHARVDTVEALHSGCIFNPPLVLEIPDTLTYFLDSLVIGPDTVAVFPFTDSVRTSTGSYPVLQGGVIVGGDTLDGVVVEGDTLVLMYGPVTVLSYTRPVLPDAWARTGPVAVRRDEEGNVAEIELLGRSSFTALTDTHAVRYDRLRVSARVRDAGWTGDGGDPETPAVGFLGGVDAGYTDFELPEDLVRALGLVPGGIGVRCS